MVDYKRDPKDNSIYWRFRIPGTQHHLEFRALALQAGPGGKTVVKVTQRDASENLKPLMTHRFDLTNGKELLWLGNQSHNNLNGDGGGFDKLAMGVNLREFADGLSIFDSDTITAELVKGDPGWTPSFLAYPYILDGGMTLMPGDPGSTKSSTGIALAISVDAGVDKLWPIEVSGVVLLINMERSKQSIAGRIGQINQVLGLEGNRPLMVFHTEGKTLLQIYSTLRQIVAKHHVTFAVLDSLSRTGIGDLNENQPANTIMDMMTELFASSLVLAHSPKGDDKKGTYGSIMFQAAADVEVNVKTHRIGSENTSWTEYQIGKANDLGVNSTSWLTFDYQEVHNPNPMIRVTRLVDIRKPSLDEIPDFNELEKPDQYLTIEEKLIRCLHDNGPLKVNDIVRLTGLKAGSIRPNLNARKGTIFGRNVDETWVLLDAAGRFP